MNDRQRILAYLNGAIASGKSQKFINSADLANRAGLIDDLGGGHKGVRTGAVEEFLRTLPSPFTVTWDSPANKTATAGFALTRA